MTKARNRVRNFLLKRRKLYPGKGLLRSRQFLQLMQMSYSLERILLMRRTWMSTQICSSLSLLVHLLDSHKQSMSRIFKKPFCKTRISPVQKVRWRDLELISHLEKHSLRAFLLRGKLLNRTVSPLEEKNLSSRITRTICSAVKVSTSRDRMPLTCSKCQGNRWRRHVPNQPLDHSGNRTFKQAILATSTLKLSLMNMASLKTSMETSLARLSLGLELV